MTEQNPGPRPRDPAPGKSTRYGILGLCMLLAITIAVYVFLYRNDLLPFSIGSATSTQTATLTPEISLTATRTMGSALVATFTSTLPAQAPPTQTSDPNLPAPFEPPAYPPAPTPPYSSDITPVLDSCQYTLKSGLNDFLYSIYWNWGIYQKFPNRNDFYAGISCAALLSNIACTYRAAYPNITQPGWILVLPGVSPNICLYHGGTPVP